MPCHVRACCNGRIANTASQPIPRYTTIDAMANRSIAKLLKMIPRMARLHTMAKRSHPNCPRSDTISIVDGVRDRVKHLLHIPPSLKANVVFDQSQYVKIAVANVLREGGIGLVLTAVMILIFLGSVRGTISVLISIPVS